MASCVHPFSIFVVLSLSFLACSTHPTYVISSNEHKLASEALSSYSKSITSSKGFRQGGRPLVFLHPVGSRVHGTVLLLHGFAQQAYDGRLQAKHLYARNFNVISFNLAGHSHVPEYWPYTILRSSAGYTKARNAIQRDPYLRSFIRKIRGAELLAAGRVFAEAQHKIGPLMNRIHRTLRVELSAKDYQTIQAALQAITKGRWRPDAVKMIHKYFISSHARYETDPLVKLGLTAALPGPVYIVGFSQGAVEALNIAALSKSVSKLVLLASGQSRSTDWRRQDILEVYYVLGSLDLLSSSLRTANGVVRVPGRVFPSVGISGNLVARDFVTTAVRETTKAACIIAEDDFAVDVSASKRFCEEKLGAKTFVYPKKFGINHFITPELGNKLGASLMEEIANFFINGRINSTNLLSGN